MFDQNQNDEVILPRSEDDEESCKIKADCAATKDELKDLEISFNFEKIELIKKMLVEIQNNITRIIYLLSGSEGDVEFFKEDSPKLVSEKLVSEYNNSSDSSETYAPKNVVINQSRGERLIEGVFNGQNMVGADGQEYAVPANYASKSKLVEGDILKLTINSNGAFIYKQIGPIERTRIVGTLIQEGGKEDYAVEYQGRRLRVLAASVTYFKGKVGDEAVILIPKNTPSKWAAVENIIKKEVE